MRHLPWRPLFCSDVLRNRPMLYLMTEKNEEEKEERKIVVDSILRDCFLIKNLDERTIIQMLHHSEQENVSVKNHTVTQYWMSPSEHAVTFRSGEAFRFFGDSWTETGWEWRVTCKGGAPGWIQTQHLSILRHCLKMDFILTRWWQFTHTQLCRCCFRLWTGS